MTRRTELVALYKHELEGVDEVHIPEHGGRGEPAHYILPACVRGVNRDALRQAMAEEGIQTSMHYPPVHHFAHYLDPSLELPHTEWVGESALSLPLYPSMTNDQVVAVCDAIRNRVGTI